MPNGMYGGVRGERKSPLLDFSAKNLCSGRRLTRMLFCIAKIESGIYGEEAQPEYDSPAGIKSEK